jgi:hypothetical protein
MASSRPLELTSAAASWHFMTHSSFVADSSEANTVPAKRHPVNNRDKIQNFLMAFSFVSLLQFDGIAKSQKRAPIGSERPCAGRTPHGHRQQAMPSAFVVCNKQPAAK